MSSIKDYADATGDAVEDVRDVDSLMTPASIVVIGASERRPAFRNALASGVRTFAVNPTRRAVLGHQSYQSVRDVPARAGVALLGVAHTRVLEAAAEAIEAGIGALVVPGLGAEAGGESAALTSRLADLTRRHSVALLGPNCMGIARPGEASLWIAELPETFRPGRVGVVAQSGSVAEGLVSIGDRVGFRAIVSSGNEVGRDTADFVAWFAADDGTTVVALFVEAVRRPAALSKALAACSTAGKMVVCLKVGRSPAAGRIALAHTGALVGSSDACSAFLRAHGVVEVADLPELVEILEVAGRGRRPLGRRLAAVSESGGEAELLCDHAERAGLVVQPLPGTLVAQLRDEYPNFVSVENPVDAWGIDSPDKVFPRSLELLAASGICDLLVAQVDLTQYRGASDQQWCKAVVLGLASAAAGRDIYPAVVSSEVNDPSPELAACAREHDLPLLRGTAAAMGALAAVAGWVPRRPSPDPEPSGVVVDDLLRPGPMSEHDSAAVLERYGVRFSPRLRATDPLAAATAAAALGFPVVVKVDGPAHKRRSGGVILGLGTPGDVERAAGRLGGRVLVAAQVPPGLEILCGMHRDPLFGPVIVAGLGGAFAEAAALVSRALAPLDDAAARELLCALPGFEAAVNPAAQDQLVSVVLALSCLAVENPAVESVDLNPLIVDGDDVVAVDALVIGQQVGGVQWTS